MVGFVHVWMTLMWNHTPLPPLACRLSLRAVDDLCDQDRSQVARQTLLFSKTLNESNSAGCVREYLPMRRF